MMSVGPSVCLSVNIWLTFAFKFLEFALQSGDTVFSGFLFWNDIDPRFCFTCQRHECHLKWHHFSRTSPGLQSNSGLWIDDVRLSVNIWLTFVFKFWNLLCNPAITSSAVSCFEMILILDSALQVKDMSVIGIGITSPIPTCAISTPRMSSNITQRSLAVSRTEATWHISRMWKPTRG